jgi:hypothetical protein
MHRIGESGFAYAYASGEGERRIFVHRIEIVYRLQKLLTDISFHRLNYMTTLLCRSSQFQHDYHRTIVMTYIYKLLYTVVRAKGISTSSYGNRKSIFISKRSKLLSALLVI